MVSKKAELTSKQLITIIILIISFTIIVAFFVILGLKSMISDESCRNSVMLRNTFSILGIKFFSLKCSTQDICFSMGGECKFEADRVIKVSDDKELQKELQKEIINLENSCWWMMGEGKVDYGDAGSCAICYNIYFDNLIGEKDLSYKEKLEYNNEYVIVTGINKKGLHFYSDFIEFNLENLEAKDCFNYVMKV